ncbi:heme-binding protein [Alkalimonas sp. MEB108]|uniref:Heme-binding protein n=1 Tax=Alkalimonas cellulosilytica TaxID=3058395 RepID=A0ABU7JA57_9GAMM|nr:heme-binding protein [Alkalimonas sp. MEB108]MEE2003153.1 heme-binding protein [Alkalimonas sp. MEB108]
MKSVFTLFTAALLAGCSVVGQSHVEIAPYTQLQVDESLGIDVRHYDAMVLVSADMAAHGQNGAFRKLFRYISGANEGARDIAMTAPVFMEASNGHQGVSIAMTAPVFMTDTPEQARMSFVMPAHFTLETTPKPTDPSVTLSEVSDYRVAAIRFSGRLSDRNVAKQTAVLQKWLLEQGYQPASAPLKAGYHGPMTLPMFRRNEVLIALQAP